MKIKLSIGKLPYSGFLNLDPLSIIEEDKRDQFNIIKDFNAINNIENASCTEILVENAIHYININHMVETIDSWITKLRHNGKIIINGTNLESIVKQYLNGQLTTLDFNVFIYGYNKDLPNYTSCVCIDEIEEVLVRAGLNITHKQLIDTEFTITGQRP